MMVAVAIMAIGLGMVVPGFQKMLASQRLSSGANEVLSVFNYARMEAVRTRGRVVVCPSSNGTSCGGDDWASAIMFADANRDGSLSAGESIVRRWDFTNTALSFTQTAGPTPARVIFGGSGLARPDAGGSSMPQMLICAQQLSEKSILVDIHPGGARSTKGNGNGCN